MSSNEMRFSDLKEQQWDQIFLYYNCQPFFYAVYNCTYAKHKITPS